MNNKKNYKDTQEYENMLCGYKLTEALAYYKKQGGTEKRLHSCTAWTIENDRFILLKSYNTFIAVYEKSTQKFYDCLRTVYGYTATSSKHISKLKGDIIKSGNDIKLCFTSR